MSDEVVVVGGGMTGLVAGAMLARSGRPVRVLEAHPRVAGGHARTVEVGGVGMSAGPQYVWGFDRGGVAGSVARYLGLDRSVSFASMDREGFERVSVGDAEPFDVPMGLDRFEERLVASFPASEHGLRRFFAIVGDLAAAAEVVERRRLYGRSGLAMRLGVATDRGLRMAAKARAMRWARCSLGELFDACRLGPRARRILYGHGGIFAESAAEVSTVVYAVATASYHRGAAVPRPGFFAIVSSLIAAIREAGGSVELASRVSAIEVAGGRAVAVRTADGRRYGCAAVVSNLAPRLTARLLPEAVAASYRYAPSRSLLSCYLVVEDGDGRLLGELAGRNLWWVSEERAPSYGDARADEPPTGLYVGSPVANGQEAPGLGPGRLPLAVYVPAGWEETRRQAATEAEHEQLRQRALAAVLEAVDRHLLPGVSSRVTDSLVLTPVDVEREIGAERGSVYGRRLTAREVLTPPSRRRLPDNLHIGCAAAGTAGVASAFRAGVEVAGGLLGEPLWPRIEAAT